MVANRRSFKIGRGAIYGVFLFIAVGGMLMSIAMAAMGEWLHALAIFASGAFSAVLCVWMPGELILDDAAIEIRRRFASQRLLWSEIDQAVWDSSGGIASLASDNWVLTLNGKSAGKKTTIVLSGPMVRRQEEVRRLLEARFPPRE